MGRHTYRGHRKRGIAGVTLTAPEPLLPQTPIRSLPRPLSYLP